MGANETATGSNEMGSKQKDGERIYKNGEELSKYIEEPWNVIQSYFEGKHLKQLVRHQIESYNDFIQHQKIRVPI